MTIPSRGDKIYKCFDGTLETAIFLEEGLADPSCSANTWLCQDTRMGSRRKFRCSTNMYVTTAQEAYEIFLKQCGEALPLYEQSIQDTVKELIDLTKLIIKVEFELDKLKYRATL